MAQDQNKKTLRHFQCRDYLWEIFEQMSQELECSTDYLINEAMRQYARSRNYGTRTPSVPGMPRAGTGPGTSGPSRPENPTPGAIPSLARPSGGPGAPPPRPAIPSAPPPPPPRPSGGPGYGATNPYGGPQQGGASYPSPGGGGGGGGYGASGGRGYGASTPQPAPASSYPPPPPGGGRQAYGTVPPPLPGGPRAGAATGAMPPLHVIFNGQKIPVAKDEFVIGRGSKTADLAIKDGNISRRHAAVVFQNGAFFMKDLGSTNGVEYQGRRVDSKRIEEGDIFQICDYELRFTYR